MADPVPVPVPLLVLASGSPRRLDLLRRLGLDPQVRPADVDETPRAGEDAAALVRRLARTKATTVAGRGDAPDGEVVLAADTTVAIGGHVLNKPQDDQDAAAMLRRLAGRTHEVHTGVAVVRGDAVHDTVVTTRVRFRALTDAEIAWYVATGEPRDKAGGYGIQGAGAVLVEHVDGSDTNVIGLPLPATVALLRRVGFDPLR